MTRNNYRDDGIIWFEDQISEMADLLITVQGIRYIYMKKHDRSWISRIGDEGMRFALWSMSEIQLRIIEALVFEDKTVTDVRREMDLTITEIRMEIRDMRKALLASMQTGDRNEDIEDSKDRRSGSAGLYRQV